MPSAELPDVPFLEMWIGSTQDGGSSKSSLSSGCVHEGRKQGKAIDLKQTVLESQPGNHEQTLGSSPSAA